MPHTYHLTLKHLSGQRENPVGETVYECKFNTHDDLTKITKKERRNEVPEAEVFEFCAGLKLLTEVTMKHCGNPKFAECFPHLDTFILGIKVSVGTECA
ncbi:hypothetical protein AM571_PC00540 (plasmid) [Rhizobium etli 8C-3]|uniref:Uncharacterized protein n=1 Tax=Rhizobium etli 8C-3 TaxID=538025 RepID=A0A1L5PDK8_RHIET|nr:DUF3861 family protein [Rhizobium etli]APO78278.1 hypothetical protein AM571_PC00540 [Rhizobium etli 8C-3]